jgi:hypothetical protein
MKRIVLFTFSVIALCYGVFLANNLRRPPQAPRLSAPDILVHGRYVEIGPGTTLFCEFDDTTKGNGMLEIANLRLKIADWHDNGEFYQNGKAQFEFYDLNGDNWKELLVMGILNYTDERSDVVVKQEPFIFIYAFDKDHNSFRQIYRHASFELEIGSQTGIAN